jgi:hypothetical protein
MSDAAIAWRRFDKPGHEFCALAQSDGGAKLTGVAVLSNKETPCCVQYTIECDAEWRTLLCRLTGYIGRKGITHDIRREGTQWLMNGLEMPDLAGCEDIDLGFSPATNLLPIRRLRLEVGQSAKIRAAWLRFPELTLELLEQTYTRLAGDRYRYESGGGTFRRDLKVDEHGFVVEYPDLWYAESHA